MDKLPEKIGMWEKVGEHYEIGNFCCIIGKDCLSFGGYRPCGWNAGKIPFDGTIEQLTEILTTVTKPNDITKPKNT